MRNGMTSPSRVLRDLIDAHRAELDAVLRKYGATNPRIFGSVARGDATGDSDIDVLVDMESRQENILFRTGGLNDEFRRILGRKVDIFPVELLRRPVSRAALADAVAL